MLSLMTTFALTAAVLIVAALASGFIARSPISLSERMSRRAPVWRDSFTR